MLREIENLVAEAVEVNVPFMNPITYVQIYFGTFHDLMVVLYAVVIVHSPIRLVSTPKRF